MSSLRFLPAYINVKVGVNSTVQWINNSTVLHDVGIFVPTSGGAFKVLPSGDMNPGSPYPVFTCTFTAIGFFDYYCSYHPGQRGKVTVYSS